MRKEDEQSVKASLKSLKGDLDSPPKPLFIREGDGEMTNGFNMIGKARLLSASPFRATLKVAKLKSTGAQESDEDSFEREDQLPELQKAHVSPIKDDSELLRMQRNDLLNAFSQSHLNFQHSRS